MEEGNTGHKLYRKSSLLITTEVFMTMEKTDTIWELGTTAKKCYCLEEERECKDKLPGGGEMGVSHSTFGEEKATAPEPSFCCHFYSLW